MTERSWDVFVSYASADRPRVEPFIRLLEADQLRVWWDQQIREGNWSDEITQALDSASRVIVFISPSAGQSGYVHAEAQRALAAGKLVPVLLDRDVPFHLNGLTALLQRYDLSQVSDLVRDPLVRKLCALCHSALGDKGPPAAEVERQTADWLLELVPTGDLPYALALSVLEGFPHEVVQQAADRFDVLARPTPTEVQERKAWTAFGRTRRARLGACRAETFEVTPAGLATPSACIRFNKADLAAQVFKEVWFEFDDLRPAMTQWLSELAIESDEAIRRSCALSVGILAQDQFNAVFNTLIGSWLASDEPLQRRTADLALAAAALAPQVASTVEASLGRWSTPDSSREMVKVALELACGHTGMRLPTVALRILRALAKRKPSDLFTDHDVDLIDEAGKAMRQLVIRGGQMEADSLFDLPQFLTELEKWSANPEDGDLPHLADYLLLTALGLIPSESKARRVDLQALWAVESAWNASVRAMERLLRSVRFRREAEDLLQRWAEPEHGGETPAVVLAFARALWRTAISDRDRERIAFALRRTFSREQLESDLDLLPVEVS